MTFGFELMKRSFAILVATVLLASNSSYSDAQVSGAGTVQAPDGLAPKVVSNILEQGRSLETDGSWGDALAHYEEALRNHPGQHALQQRFDNARLHYSFDRRHGDRSFRRSVETLNANQALEMYSELLSKIDTHYFEVPPWQKLVYRGVRSLEIALADREFCSLHHLSTNQDQLARMHREIREIAVRSGIQTSHDASTKAAEIARLVGYRTGLSESAVLMEFIAAAADGLDSYSAFLTADQLRDVYSQIEGNFVGLGVELKADDGALLIVHVIPGSPAKRSGILEGDRIVAVDGQKTSELSTDEAAGLLTGVEGSFVRITIERTGQFSKTITVRREHVDVPSLEDVGIVDPSSGVAYIKIPAFQKATAADMESALWELHRQGMKSLVIDLRGNPGGLLTASVELADKFVASGRIVSTRGRSHAETFDYRAHRGGTWRVPLVVLIDGDSASASEIFAAAIKDTKRGKIIGSRSYGKGSVQGIFSLGHAGTGIRLTTAKFFSPHDRPISKFGVHPDIDTRRATQAISGQVNGNKEYAAGYRGVEDITQSDVSFVKVDNGILETVVDDATLAKAIDVARNEPPPVL